MLDRPQRRIRFIECSVQDHGDRVATTVALADGDTPFEGTAERPTDEGGARWAAAEATVLVLRQVYDLAPDQVTLKDVVSFDIGGHPAVATSLLTTVGGERRSLFGLSRIVDSEGQAAVLAVLGATNRFFGAG